MWLGNTQDKSALRNGARLFYRRQACHDPSSSSREQLKALGFMHSKFGRRCRDWRMRTVGSPPQPDSQALKQKTPCAAIQFGRILCRRSLRTKPSGMIGFTHCFTPTIPTRRQPRVGTIPCALVLSCPMCCKGCCDSIRTMCCQAPEISQSWKASEDGFDKTVSDLVAYLVWMSGPNRNLEGAAVEFLSPNPGCFVLLFLGLLLLVVLALKREYWKDVH